MHRPMRRPGTSEPTSTALTPGTRSALLVSIRLMRAYGTGLLKQRPHNVSGNFRSALYCALPVTLSSPSTRGVGLPTTCVIQFLRYEFLTTISEQPLLKRNPAIV